MRMVCAGLALRQTSGVRLVSAVGLAAALFAQGCATSYVPKEYDFQPGAVPAIEVRGAVGFTNAQDSTERVTLSSYAGISAEGDYHSITDMMIKDATRVVRDNQRSLGGATPKTIALKVTSLQSRYIAFFWRSEMKFTATLGSGQVVAREVTHAAGDTISDLNGCIAEAVIVLLNDPAVRVYLSS